MTKFEHLRKKSEPNKEAKICIQINSNYLTIKMLPVFTVIKKDNCCPSFILLLFSAQVKQIVFERINVYVTNVEIIGLTK